MYIKYQDLPGFRSIYLDYINNENFVKQYYNQNFRDEKSYTDKFNEIAGYERLHRNLLPDIISEQYDDQYKSQLLKTNLDLLNNSNTLAVVTGQQLELYSGPLYTIYKIITAIKFARKLKEQYDGYNFVPIFWLEGDDHDFEEVASFSIFNKTNELVKLKYEDGKTDEANRGSIGKLAFNENFDTLAVQLKDELKETEFKDSLVDSLNEIYNSSSTFINSFRKFLNKLFGEYGLIVFDPQDAKIKKLLRPIFKNELTNYRLHSDTAIQVSAQLDEHYHAQVKVKPVNLFLNDKDGRHLIEPTEEGFKLRNKRNRFSLDELLDRIDTDPSDFSPNVLLRPVCQDYILPTAFYVGGPAEIAYFAQVVPNYDFFNVPKPFVFPRASTTIVEKNILGLLEKFELNITDVFGDGDELKNRIVNNLSEVDINKIFDASAKDINIALDKLKEQLFAIDPTLIDNANKSLDKILHTLNIMKSKSENAMNRKHDIVLRQVNKVLENLYPNGNYQEREINYLSFAVKYGDDIIKWLFNELTINKFEHQILEI